MWGVGGRRRGLEKCGLQKQSRYKVYFLNIEYDNISLKLCIEKLTQMCLEKHISPAPAPTSCTGSSSGTLTSGTKTLQKMGNDRQHYINMWRGDINEVCLVSL